MQTNLLLKYNNYWKIEQGSIPGVGVIHKSDIFPTLELLETHMKIPLQNNIIGSAGKREFSGDIDIAVMVNKNLTKEIIYKKLKEISFIKNIHVSDIISISVPIVNWNKQKYKNVESTGSVQVDFMFSKNIDLLKLFYHSPYEYESKYKGLYRNILLGAIAHYYDLKFSKQFILKDIPLYEERYFWSSHKGLYRGRKYKILSKDKNYVLKKTINVDLDTEIYTTPSEIIKLLNLSDISSLYSFEKLYEDINNRYDPILINTIIEEFIENRYVKYYGIPIEINNNKEVEHES